MRKHKFNLRNPFAGIGKRNFPLKVIIVITIILIGLLFVISGVNRFLRNSDYFAVKDIIFTGTDNIADFSYLKGENIFSFDLDKESSYISEHYPACRKVRLIRLLPNRLFIDFMKRKAVAIVKLYRYFCIDEGGTIFEPTEQFAEMDLPLILGLETKIFGPRSGKKYNIKELELALKIIKELNSNRSLKEYKIKRIDVATIEKASFFLSPKLKTLSNNFVSSANAADELEIKLDADDTSGKMNILFGLLTQSKDEVGNIKYIDLRFKEPVIKLKDAK